MRVNCLLDITQVDVNLGGKAPTYPSLRRVLFYKFTGGLPYCRRRASLGSAPVLAHMEFCLALSRETVRVDESRVDERDEHDLICVFEFVYWPKLQFGISIYFDVPINSVHELA